MIETEQEPTAQKRCRGYGIQLTRVRQEAGCVQRECPPEGCLDRYKGGGNASVSQRRHREAFLGGEFFLGFLFGGEDGEDLIDARDFEECLHPLGDPNQSKTASVIGARDVRVDDGSEPGGVHARNFTQVNSGNGSFLAAHRILESKEGGYRQRALQGDHALATVLPGEILDGETVEFQGNEQGRSARPSCLLR